MSLWSKKTKPNLPTSSVTYPVGTAVVTESNRYFINRDGKKYRIQSNAIWQSWAFPLVVHTSEVAVSKYPTAVTKLAFRDGSLLNNIADGKLYIVSDGVLRHITSPSLLERLGNPTATLVSDAEIKIMKQGEEIY